MHGISTMKKLLIGTYAVFQMHGISAVIDFYLEYIPYYKCMVYVL